MEEILASIRRIIEDSDTGRRPPIDIDGPTQDGELEQESESAAPEIAAFRAEFRGEPQVVKPVTLSEVQARIDSEKQPVTEAAETGSRPMMTLAEVGARVTGEGGSKPVPSNLSAIGSSPDRGADATTDVDAAKTETVSPEFSGISHKAQATPRETETAAPDVVAGASDVTKQPEAAHPEPAGLEKQPAKPALVSEQTSRQVAAAFGELSEAFANRSRKSFDEMAEEMLRPMLQDWLDNNLPTLVERLVREEIERVARGT